ncbi:hypothetical protein B0I35DRAFT_433281 [Stachybotrys elegans]|uniref:Uncharacterized protein n=1 Tax=Stachybotrys elegans TaxID=80388 RepID=A0A8K0WPR8_9HYPO|nr:hypothetical protein B0I35DRAFT_433281 [Stachybotrys elegans]
MRNKHGIDAALRPSLMIAPSTAQSSPFIRNWWFVRASQTTAARRVLVAGASLEAPGLSQQALGAVVSASQTMLALLVNIALHVPPAAFIPLAWIDVSSWGARYLYISVLVGSSVIDTLVYIS